MVHDQPRASGEIEVYTIPFVLIFSLFSFRHHEPIAPDLLCVLRATDEETGSYIRSLRLGAARIILSTRRSNSAASLAELTTAFFSL